MTNAGRSAAAGVVAGASLDQRGASNAADWECGLSRSPAKTLEQLSWQGSRGLSVASGWLPEVLGRNERADGILCGVVETPYERRAPRVGRPEFCPGNGSAAAQGAGLGRARRLRRQTDTATDDGRAQQHVRTIARADRLWIGPRHNRNTVPRQRSGVRLCQSVKSSVLAAIGGRRFGEFAPRIQLPRWRTFRRSRAVCSTDVWRPV